MEAKPIIRSRFIFHAAKWLEHSSSQEGNCVNERLEITRVKNPARQEDCLIQDKMVVTVSPSGNVIMTPNKASTLKHLQISNHMKFISAKCE